MHKTLISLYDHTGGDDVAYVHKINTCNNNITSCNSKLLNYKHKDSASCSLFVNNALAVGSYDGTMQSCNNTNDHNNIFLNLEGPSDVEFLTFHPNSNGTTSLAGSYDGTVWLFHL